MNQPLDARRKRILFRSQRRGTKESDLVIGGFAAAYLASLDDVQLDRFEALLDCSDPELLGWVVGAEAPPPEHDNDVLKLMKTFKNGMQ